MLILKRESNSYLKRYIENFGSFIPETIYLIITNFSIKKCMICGSKVTRFINAVVGYGRTCSKECSIRLQVKNTDFKEVRRKQLITINNDPILKEKISKKLRDSMTPERRATSRQTLLKCWENGTFDDNYKPYSERYNKEDAAILKNKISETTKKGMNIVYEDGTTLGQRVNRQRVKTMQSVLDENGVNLIQKNMRKVSEKRRIVDPETGLNDYQVSFLNRDSEKAYKKYENTMKTTFDENGVSLWDIKNHKHSITMKNKFSEILDKDIITFLYVFELNNIIKIGWSSNYKKRIRSIEKATDKKATIIKIISGKYKEIRELEIKLHYEFNDFNIIPYFPNLKNKNKIGKTEWFSKKCQEKLIENLNIYEMTSNTPTIKE
jgi:hypothetical protein